VRALVVGERLCLSQRWSLEWRNISFSASRASFFNLSLCLCLCRVVWRNEQFAGGGTFAPLVNTTVSHWPLCDISIATFRWEVDDWSACSKSCGDGVRTRAVACVTDRDGRKIKVGAT
jgi:hypothetical protein